LVRVAGILGVLASNGGITHSVVIRQVPRLKHVGHNVCGFITVTTTLGMSEDGLRGSAVGHRLLVIGFRLPPKCVTNHIGIGPLRG
jgi:hypothetical protein